MEEPVRIAVAGRLLNSMAATAVTVDLPVQFG
jgi:hypothetical protein